MQIFIQMFNNLAMILIGMLFGYILSNDSIRNDCSQLGKATVLKNSFIVCKVIYESHPRITSKSSSH